MPVEDVWLEGAHAPPSFASRAAAVALVLGCVFAVFFFIGHATAGGGTQAEPPVGTAVGVSQAVVPDGLAGVPALGALEAPPPVQRPAPVVSNSGGARTVETAAPETQAPVPAAEPEATRPAPAPAPRPAPSSGGGHARKSSGGGGSFDSSG
jgi:hypothetical protein